MTTEPNAPYDWLKSIPPSVLEVDEIPLTGKVQAFPWQRYVEALIKQFELGKLSLHPKEWKWLESHDLFMGVGADPYLIKIGLSGYEGNAFFAINPRDLQAAIYLFVLHRTPEVNPIDSAYEEAFYKLLTIAFCEQFSALNWEKGLQPFILPTGDFIPETMLAMDIDVEAGERHFNTRLFLDNTLRQSWKDKHAIPFEIDQNPTLAQKLTLPVSIEAGYFNMRQHQWSTLKPGDFVFLDGCTISDSLQDGTLLLRIYDIPYYKAQLSEGNITLNEQPSYSEIESTMPKNDDESDFDFDDDTDLEDTEHDEKTEHEDEDSDFNFDDDSDFDFDDDSEIEHDIDTGDTPKDTKAAAPAAAAPAKPATASKQTAAAPASGNKTDVTASPAKPAGSLKDIPMHVVVEVGRFQMSVEKMMSLQPGNMLNLNVRPEDGVDLVVNGRRIGRGELLKFGETLGVRITEVG